MVANDDEARAFTIGWYIVGFTALSQFFSIGIGYYAFSAFLKPLTEALDENRAVVSLALTLQMILVAGAAPLVGRLLGHYSIRWVMSIGVLAMSAGLVICASATEIWHIYLGFGVVLAAGASLTGNLPCNFILANWFVRRRGSAIGISQTGITVSGAVLVPLASYLVVSCGWRSAFIAFAIMVPLLLLPAIWKFAIATPAEMGLQPDGDPAPDKPSETHSSDDEQEPAFGFFQAIRNKDIWLISLFAGPCYMAIGAIVISLPAHGTDLGLSIIQASTVVSVTTIFGAMAKPLAGITSDYVPKKLVAGIAILLQVAAVLVLLNVTSLIGLCVAGGLFGLGYGGIAPLWSLLLAERFGVADFAKVMGASMPITMPFNVIGLPVANYVFEVTGSYLPAFAGLLVGYLLSAVCLLMLRLPTDQPQQA